MFTNPIHNCTMATAITQITPCRLPTPSLRHGTMKQARQPARSYSRSFAMATAPATDQGFVTLPDGMKLELIHCPPQSSPSIGRPPLLMLHGSYHGAWCWRERWLPYFASKGHDCYAFSIRGQGSSDRITPDGKQLTVSGDLQSLTDDLAHVVAQMPAAPVLIAHSFGALLAEKYALDISSRPPLAGIAIVCGVPPSGNKGIIMRVFRSSLLLAWRITWTFVGKSFARDLAECRFAFFSEDLPIDDLKRYPGTAGVGIPNSIVQPFTTQQAASSAGTTLMVSADICGWQSRRCDSGLASGLWRLPAGLGVQPVKWSTAHDCMLDTRWEAAAASLGNWLDTLHDER